MDSSGDELIQISDAPKRRKKCQKEWAKNVAKRQRNSAEGKRDPAVACQHPEYSYCKANTLSNGTIQEMFHDCYVDSNKVRQDTFIASHVLLSPVKRRRQANGRGSQRRYTASYFVTTEEGVKEEVCQKSFLSILSIGKKRLGNIISYLWEHNNPRPERRGGARLQPGYVELKQLISNLIMRFKCRSSHYGRNKTPHKKYLPSTLSVKKMYQLFIGEVYRGPIDVKYQYYHNIFINNFNIGFGNPRKDVCSYCTSHKVQIKVTENTERKKELVTELLVHKMRAKKFYQLMNTKQNESVLIVAFDLMQNIELPRSSIGEAYYARQLWLYFLGIIEHKPTGNKNIPGTQQKNDVHFYTWGEHQRGRGANQIASALTHFINNRLQAPNHGIKKIILFSDSCVGQNKNYTVLSAINMISTKHQLPVTHIFPVRGHSYMPPDRAFGRVEQKLNKKETVLLPADYYAEFEEVGRVHVFGRDWSAYDFKEIADTYLKKHQAFKISEAKMLEVNPAPAPIKFFTTYSGAPCEHTILKRGKHWRGIEVNELKETDNVKAAKKHDVRNLVKSMGFTATMSSNTHRPFTQAQAIAEFYDHICRENIVDQASDSEDENTVEVNEDQW